MKYYCAYGIRIASEIDLPIFSTIVPSNVEVTIQYKVVRSGHSINSSSKGFIQLERCHDDCVVMAWQDLRYVISKSGIIVIESPRPRAGKMEVQPFYGVIFAIVLLILRQHLIFHGSAFEINGKAIVVVGDKGQGKSTLAALFVSKGCKLISDDVTVVSFQNGQLSAIPGVSCLRLWPDSILSLGYTPENHAPVNSLTEKRIVQIDEKQFASEVSCLSAIILLAPGEDGVRLEKVKGVSSLLNLLRHQYFARYDAILEPFQKKNIFRKCEEVVKAEMLIRLSRPKDFGHLTATYEKILSLIEKGFISL